MNAYSSGSRSTPQSPAGQCSSAANRAPRFSCTRKNASSGAFITLSGSPSPFTSTKSTIVRAVVRV
ncbi:hypothetical protein WMF28_39710 [Sorangium sp. So ce590]|uniref:hypothetical protein n=1 Tax=Sorangium sp. So ce590 TaxID=3133317 RepID=UPI003F5DDA47